MGLYVFGHYYYHATNNQYNGQNITVTGVSNSNHGDLPVISSEKAKDFKPINASISLDEAMGQISKKIYKCVSANGNIAFADVCPDGYKVSQVGTKGTVNTAESFKSNSDSKPQVQQYIKNNVVSMGETKPIDSEKQKLCDQLFLQQDYIHSQQKMHSYQYLRDQDRQISDQIDNAHCLKGH